MTVDLKAIYTEWQNNAEFRDAFKKDPLKALKQSGFTVNQDDLKKIKATLNVDDSKNSQLDERINR